MEELEFNLLTVLKGHSEVVWQIDWFNYLFWRLSI